MTPEIPSDDEDLTPDPTSPIPTWLLEAGRKWQAALQEYRFHVRTCASCTLSKEEFPLPLRERVRVRGIVHVSHHCPEGERLLEIERRLSDVYVETSMKFVPERDVPGYKEWTEAQKEKDAWRGEPGEPDEGSETE